MHKMYSPMLVLAMMLAAGSVGATSGTTVTTSTYSSSSTSQDINVSCQSLVAVESGSQLSFTAGCNGLVEGSLTTLYTGSLLSSAAP